MEQGERIYRGVGVCGGETCSVGRLYMHKRGGKAPSGLCMLYISDRSATCDIGRLLGVGCFSGAVLCPEAASVELMGLLSVSGIPYAVLGEELPRELEGRVALLDTRRDVLSVSPAIDTIGLYSDRAGIGLPAAFGGEREGLLSVGLSFCRDGVGAMLRELPERSNLEQWLTDTVEELCGCPLTVCIRVPKRESEGDIIRFCRQTEAIFSAAVYGSVSVLLSGYACAEEIGESLRLMSRVFCELESDGREFNGYLPRGLVIDSPIWLSGTPPCSVDLVCFDYDRLICLLTGGYGAGERNELPWEEIFRLFESYASRLSSQTRIQVLTGKAGVGASFDEWRRRIGAEEIYRI